MYMVSEDLLHHNVAELIGRDEVEKRIAAGEKLRVKLGVDPSKPDLHIGHALTLRKLRAFQDAGHTAVLIIGDYTAQLGDPSDRTEARKILSVDEVKRNAEGYLAQVFMILDEAETEVHYQTEWFNDFTLASGSKIISRYMCMSCYIH
jgi:tyrosyl-tRNA synthetase